MEVGRRVTGGVVGFCVLGGDSVEDIMAEVDVDG